MKHNPARTCLAAPLFLVPVGCEEGQTGESGSSASDPPSAEPTIASSSARDGSPDTESMNRDGINPVASMTRRAATACSSEAGFSKRC